MILTGFRPKKRVLPAQEVYLKNKKQQVQAIQSQPTITLRTEIKFKKKHIFVCREDTTPQKGQRKDKKVMAHKRTRGIWTPDNRTKAISNSLHMKFTLTV